MNKSEIVNEVCALLHNGNAAEAVEFMMKGTKTKPCKVAVLASMVTESLIKSGDMCTLKFFVNKLEFYHTNDVQY